MCCSLTWSLTFSIVLYSLTFILSTSPCLEAFEFAVPTRVCLFDGPLMVGLRWYIQHVTLTCTLIFLLSLCIIFFQTLSNLYIVPFMCNPLQRSLETHFFKNHASRGHPRPFTVINSADLTLTLYTELSQTDGALRNQFLFSHWKT